MIDNIFNDNVRYGKKVIVRYGGYGDSYFTLTCEDDDEKSYYIDRDTDFFIVKKYIKEYSSMTYIPLSSIIDIKIINSEDK